MKCLFAIVMFVFLMISQSNFCQIDPNSNINKTFAFKCFDQTDSIRLPADFIGPKYFYYVEGSIVTFVTPDSITIEILCGADAELTLDSLYYVVDSIKSNGQVVSIRYINKGKMRYARQDYYNDFAILYHDVPSQKRNEFDLLFDLVRAKKEKKNNMPPTNR